MANKKIYIIIGVLAVVFAIVGSALLIVGQKKIDGYVKTKAQVVDYERKREYDPEEGSYYLYAEVVIYTVDGKNYRATNKAYTNSPKRVGGSIEIAYNPKDPSDCVFVKNNYIFPLVMFVFSGMLILGGIAKFVSDCVRND